MNAQPPSEPLLDPRDRQELLGVIRRVSLRRGHFVLSSGATSDYYLDLRLTTTDPDGARLAAEALLREAVRLGATGVGGPTLGADPIVGATVARSAGTLHPIRGFLVRAAAKQHGTGRQIEGHLLPGQRVVLLDDVVTSAGSLLRAAEAVRDAGAEIVGAFCLVDRDGGGREALAAAGLQLTAVFQVSEVLLDGGPDGARDSRPDGARDSGPDGARDSRPDDARDSRPDDARDSRPDDARDSGPDDAPEKAAAHLKPNVAALAGEGHAAPTWPPSTPRLTVDAILELVPGHVLLVERKNPPHGWALPGGFVEEHESLEEALRREVEEETGLRIVRAQQLHTYSGPDRDPRFATASCVFVGVAHGEFHAGDDAVRGRLFPLDELPAEIAFDHGRIVVDFRQGVFGIGPGQLH